MMRAEANPNKIFDMVKHVQFGLPEIITAIVFTASITGTVVLWAMNTFESKKDATEREIVARAAITEMQKNTDARASSLEARLQGVENNIFSMSKDVSYIRGRLEPRNKN